MTNLLSRCVFVAFPIETSLLYTSALALAIVDPKAFTLATWSREQSIGGESGGTAGGMGGSVFQSLRMYATGQIAHFWAGSVCCLTLLLQILAPFCFLGLYPHQKESRTELLVFSL